MGGSAARGSAASGSQAGEDPSEAREERPVRGRRRARRGNRCASSARGGARRRPLPRGGPVDDLERHLPADWWKHLFDPLYLRTDGDVVENDAATRSEVDVLVDLLRPTAGTRILDVCCGQGRHVLELARRGLVPVTGVDASRYLLGVARRRARAARLPACFLAMDARRLRLPDASFDIATLLGNSFGYFEREDDDGLLLREVRRVLAPGGVIALDLTDGAWVRSTFAPRSWEWLGGGLHACRERALARDGRRIVCREIVVHARRGILADRYYAERLYAREEAEALLRAAGFVDVTSRGIIEGASHRGQDLGMMGRRMMLTARVPDPSRRVAGATEPAAPPPPGEPAGGSPGVVARDRAPLVAVILGDPTLPDRAKKDGRFGPEDLDLVRRLRETLATIPGYRFAWFDRHATLVDDLRAARPDFALNLCDEGFRNDASHEADVPALLDVLGIPYTGGDPACLVTCCDKSLVRGVAAAAGVPVPAEVRLEPGDSPPAGDGAFPLPAIVKPAVGDDSPRTFRASVFADGASLGAFLATARAAHPELPLLVQEWLDGDEWTVAVLDAPGAGPRALGVLRVDYARLPAGLPRILAYDWKWDYASPWVRDVRLEPVAPGDRAGDLVRAHAVALFRRLRCRDFARFDFRAGGDGRPRLLEANPNPGWGHDCRAAISAAAAGVDYAALLAAILACGAARAARRSLPVPA